MNVEDAITSSATLFDICPPGGHPTSLLEIAVRLQGFQGLERAFVMVPSEKTGELTWTRHALDFNGSAVAGYYNRDVVDFHGATVAGVDPQAVTKHGLAVGLETNLGVVWTQQSGENLDVVRW